MDWGIFKRQMGEQLHISDDALHVHAGMAILILVALVLRRPPWNWRPLLVVAVIEAVNEIYDMRSLGVRPNNESALPDSIHDFVLTMLWPVVIAITWPLFRRFLAERGK
ncbi:hypothetical protein AB5I39_03980 [Sphingomonas sp. MMS24-J45]|uniref:hypothetical protein n=1 Tax=Sphingomonas sp. MMS24-J45 TaxID=3238806 RepID=UPI00384F0D35